MIADILVNNPSGLQQNPWKVCCATLDTVPRWLKGRA